MGNHQSSSGPKSGRGHLQEVVVTGGSKGKALTRKILLFWIGGRLCEVIPYERWSHMDWFDCSSNVWVYYLFFRLKQLFWERDLIIKTSYVPWCILQSCNRLSFPTHCVSSIQILPVPCPNLAEEYAATASPIFSCRQITLASWMSKLSSQTVPHSPLWNISTRPSSKLLTPPTNLMSGTPLTILSCPLLQFWTQDEPRRYKWAGHSVQFLGLPTQSEHGDEQFWHSCVSGCPNWPFLQ